MGIDMALWHHENLDIRYVISSCWKPSTCGTVISLLSRSPSEGEVDSKVTSLKQCYKSFVEAETKGSQEGDTKHKTSLECWQHPADSLQHKVQKAFLQETHGECSHCNSGHLGGKFYIETCHQQIQNLLNGNLKCLNMVEIGQKMLCVIFGCNEGPCWIGLLS